MKDILKNIREIREIKGYSQIYMGSKLDLTQGAYNLIENRKRELSYNLLLQIAIVFEMDVCEIIKWGCQNDKKSFTEKVFIQIEVEKEAKDQVLSIIYGNNNLRITNNETKEI